MVKARETTITASPRRGRFITLLAIHIGAIGLLWLPVMLAKQTGEIPAAGLLVFAPAVECEAVSHYADQLFGLRLDVNPLFPMVFILHYGMLLWLIVWKPLSSRRKGVWFALTIQILLSLAALYVFKNGMPPHQ